MKKLLTLLLFLTCYFSNAQNRILFSYDAAGNQTRRVICLYCPTSKQITDLSKLTEDDLIKSDVSDQIYYYPNPVKEELYVKWILVEDKKVETISVYNLNGALLQQFKNLNTNNLQIIPFSTYPQGIYTVMLFYNNGEEKSLKIVKN